MSFEIPKSTGTWTRGIIITLVTLAVANRIARRSATFARLMSGAG